MKTRGKKLDSAAMAEHVRDGKSGVIWEGQVLDNTTSIPTDEQIARAENDRDEARIKRESQK